MSYKYPDEDQGITIPVLDIAAKKEFIDLRLNEHASSEFYSSVFDAMIDDYDDDPFNCTPIFFLEKKIDEKFEELYLKEQK